MLRERKVIKIKPKQNMSTKIKRHIILLGFMILSTLLYIITFESNLELSYKGITVICGLGLLSVISCTLIDVVESKSKAYINKFKP